MRLQHMTWPEVEEYLREKRSIIVPIGSTEQHGPTGLIGTDAISAEQVALGVGEAEDVIVAPTLAIGMAQHHLGFAGSITLRPSTLIAMIRDVVESLARHGFERFFFINGHGGNIATVTAAFSEIYAERSLRAGASANAAPAVECRLKNWWQTPTVHALSKELYGIAEGSHATPSEVAVTQFLHPETIKEAALDPPIAPQGGFTDAANYRHRFPDGRIGSNPGLATPEAGRRIYEAAVADIAAEFRKWASGSA
ncbi:MAG TPA: creatininase family protein [Stellaceae bacterium]